jgi:YD repeat-containing protein
VEALQGNVAKASATSGSGGTYTISNLAPGTYDVRVSASSYGTLISAGNTVGVGSPTTVNAALPNAGTDSGKVTQSNGTTAIVGAIVTALQGGIAVSSATTDSSGNFSIANLSAGTYLVQAAAAGYTTQLTPGISVTAGSTTTTNFSLPGQSTITYAYDDLGRLTGVVDSQNGSATYHYDAVGNITAIDRATASQISISSFSPIKASVGSTVTINGNNFSATSSSDTLTFNGTSATITSASTTQLIVTVPTGATTGTISVTSPAGSATSSQSFTVTTAAGSPTITGISPTTAVAGNSLSVTGTNFDSTASHDTAVLNTLSAITSSASTTSLSVTVPSTATTGKLRVTTPRGSAASTGYVFVPSSGHVASDVSNTYQLTSLPATQTVQISTANKMAILAFDGVAGQRVTLKTSNSTFANGCGVPGTLYSPSGAALFNHGCIGNNNVFMDATLLPSTGTYALHLGPDTTTTGQVDIAVGSVNPDVTGQLVINGSSAPVTIATWGQNAFFTFNGTAGQSATVHITSNTVPGMNVYLYSPQGTQLASTQAAGSSFNLAQVTLPITGSYLIKIDPNGGSQYTGALNVSVTSP